MANIIKFGSLCLDGFPVNVGTEYKPGQAIKIGETTPGKEISWVVVNNLLIADHSILTGISWDDLNANGLVFGKEISAGGFRFTERLLRVGKEGGMPNEWDAALDATGDDDAIWHWQGIYFWGQEAAKRASPRIVRGYLSARSRGRVAANRGTNGFRPAMAPLISSTLDNVHDGEKLMLWGGQSIVFGRLEEISRYEVVLSDGGGVLSNGFGTLSGGGFIVIDRDAVVGLQIAQREVP